MPFYWTKMANDPSWNRMIVRVPLNTQDKSLIIFVKADQNQLRGYANSLPALLRLRTFGL